MKDVIRFYIGVYGEWVGLMLISLVSVWDLIRIGARGFFEYRVGWVGIVIIWVGLLLIRAGKHLDKNRW
ncbi:MAG: hypothetical protein ABFC84_16760 [Veillonellales bacterium]